MGINEKYLDFCVTNRQKEVVIAVIEHGSLRAAAKALGSAYTSVHEIFHKVQKRAAMSGKDPENNLDSAVPAGHFVTGISRMTKEPDGSLLWTKTNIAKEKQLELMKEAIKALTDDVPRVEKRKTLSGKELAKYNDDLMAVYPLGDPHIGMMAWGEECGEDWDLKISEAKFTEVFDRLVRTAPHCKQAVILNLGDFFHADNTEGVTQRSGHHLDLDGRYSKMIRVGMKIMRRMIESALEIHGTVRVINVIGNHDDTGAMFLSVALANIYENEPRVIIDISPAPFHYVRFGKVLIGAHHGHTCKADRLPGVMAADRARDWGETEHRYWMTGHIHHDTLKEYPGVKVESFRTLAAKDAYAAWGGYRSGQDSKCIVMHNEYGEVERHTVNIAQVK
ncbi:hypothetical protein UFOVP150_28 [uncultured Caudovirales phage]|uniref:Uncharacterized protein n=1 Tax=uncultured Caudovirales phage TaxID=2100421 RepID=A0A6J7W6Q5_9CAUD|nr:hypothetical protein UFOVP150_28 [uncultured Caudovirales phage]